MTDTIASAYIHVANGENFQSLVLANSSQGPVLVNFWSKNAGPCLRQYPVLEKLVQEHEGHFLLANVDTELNAHIIKDYGVTSVPTLKLFRDGVVVETRHGYQSEADINQMLSQYIARDSDKALAKALAEYAQGHQERAYQTIADAIVNDPGNPNLPIALCKLLKYEQRYDEAMNLLAALPEEISKLREVAILRDELGFITIADKITDVDNLIDKAEKNKDTIGDKEQLSAFYILNQEYELALQILAEITELDAHYHDDYARISILKVFNILGNDHDLVKKYRPSLNRYAH